MFSAAPLFFFWLWVCVDEEPEGTQLPQLPLARGRGVVRGSVVTIKATFPPDRHRHGGHEGGLWTLTGSCYRPSSCVLSACSPIRCLGNEQLCRNGKYLLRAEAEHVTLNSYVKGRAPVRAAIKRYSFLKNVGVWSGTKGTSDEKRPPLLHSRLI